MKLLLQQVGIGVPVVLDHARVGRRTSERDDPKLALGLLQREVLAAKAQRVVGVGPFPVVRRGHVAKIAVLKPFFRGPVAWQSAMY